MSNWAEEMSEEEWAELEEDCRLCEEEEARGEYEVLTEENLAEFLAGVKSRGRAMLAAERRKAS